MSPGTPFSVEDVTFGLAFGLAILFAAWPLLRRSAEPAVLFTALVAKLLVSLAFSAYVIFVTRGDVTLYHYGGIGYASALRSNVASGALDYVLAHPFFWVGNIPTDNAIAFSGVIHALLFDSFLASSFVFAVIGFAGQVLIYRTFVSYYPDPRLRMWWRVGILFFPTLTFWSSGLLKDPLGIFGMGCVLWGIRNLLERVSVRYLLLTALGGYTLLLFRPQIALVLFLAAVPWFRQARKQSERAPGERSMRKRGGRLIRAGLIVGSVAMVFVVGYIFPQFSLAQLPQSVASQNSEYAAIAGAQSGVYTPVTPIVHEPSWSSLISTYPAALLTSLYRPFPWEAASPAVLLAALENLALLLLTARMVFHTARERTILVRALGSPLFLTCLIFVALFSLGVGESTPNLGTISRYRIPMVPFLVGAFIILEYQLMQLHARVNLRRSQVDTAPVTLASN